MRTRKLSTTSVLCITVVLSLTANVLLLFAVRAASSQYQDLKDEDELDANALLPSMNGSDPHGTPLTVSYSADAKHTLLVVFTPQCSFCAKNWPNWSKLMESLNKDKVRVVAVDLSGTVDAEYIRTHDLASVHLFKTLDYRTGIRYKLKSVPTTMLLDPKGTLRYVWKGVLTPEALAMLEQEIGGPAQQVSVRTEAP